MADYWLENVDSALETLAAFAFAQSEQEAKWIADLKQPLRKRKEKLPTDPALLSPLMLKRELEQIGDYHPFAPLSLWEDKTADELSAEWNRQIEQHREDSENAEKAKRNATFYADLRKQKTLDAWSLEGNGLDAKVSPAGSFAIAGEGSQAITGIYPAGVYSNLLSDKHSATLVSPNHIAKGKWSAMRAIGLNGAVRMSVRQYPLEQGLHPYENTETGMMQWLPLIKYPFWNDEQVHFQISTAADKPVKNTEGRSWFGVTEVIGGDLIIKELGAPLYSVLENTP